MRVMVASPSALFKLKVGNFLKFSDTAKKTDFFVYLRRSKVLVDRG